jgi:hypothetical protein
MCIYCKTTKYRKIYENHFGPIPKDKDGRTYDIHHIDGNHSNNSIENIRALPIEEHYDIHYSQGDWGACVKMLIRIQASPAEISRLSSLCQRKRVTNGTHHFLRRSDGSSLSHEMNITRVEDRTHQMLKQEDGNSIGRKANIKRLSEGTHNLPLNGDSSKHNQYDHTIYTFIHTSGKTETCTRNELEHRYHLHQGNFSGVMRGVRNQTGGWKLSKISPQKPKFPWRQDGIHDDLSELDIRSVVAECLGSLQ